MLSLKHLSSVFPALAVVSALLLGGCGKEGRAAPGVVSRERFIAANIAMRAVPDTAARADSLRAAALQKHRLTEKELRDWVAAQRDPAELASVWAVIADSVDRIVQKRDSAEIVRQREAGIEDEIMRAREEGRDPASVVGRATVDGQILTPPELDSADAGLPPGIKRPRRVPRPGEARPGDLSRPRALPPGARRIEPPSEPPPDARRPWVPPPGDTLTVRRPDKNPPR